jgi:hypothetical protein
VSDYMFVERIGIPTTTVARKKTRDDGKLSNMVELALWDDQEECPVHPFYVLHQW